jgi:DNA-directed RNA polymerase subunit RPC12/RpoP
MTFNELLEENKKLESWIDELQSGMWINCVYCGHRYGPNAGPNTKDFNLTMRKALEQHISECPKHPLSAAKQQIADHEQRIKELEAANYQMAMDRAAAERKVIILNAENERLHKIVDEALADGYACGRIYGLPIFEGGCGEKVLKHESYRCADCMASFHRDCIRKHFKSHKEGTQKGGKDAEI